MRKKVLLGIGIAVLTTTALLSLNLKTAKADGIFCSHGSKGVCLKNAGSVGFSCVITSGTNDCDGTHGGNQGLPGI